MATEGVPGLNDRAWLLVHQMASRAAELGVVTHPCGGGQIIDAGVKTLGSLNAGLWVARVCLADLGTVQLVPGTIADTPTPHVVVNINHPVAACMASQYAGWQIKDDSFFAMGSGPFRAAFGNEKLYDQIGFREKAGCSVGVLETASLPTADQLRTLAQKCHVQPNRMVLICAPTASLVGSVQVVARSVETAMHKLHAMDFDLKQIVGGFGSAPLPPVAKDDMAAIGRTNDAILYGGQVNLMVKCPDDDLLANIAKRLPASSSSDYGTPFAQLFKAYDYDFYKIDPMLFSPAQVVLQNLSTGCVHRAGKCHHEILETSFFS